MIQVGKPAPREADKRQKRNISAYILSNGTLKLAAVFAGILVWLIFKLG